MDDFAGPDITPVGRACHVRAPARPTWCIRSAPARSRRTRAPKPPEFPVPEMARALLW